MRYLKIISLIYFLNLHLGFSGTTVVLVGDSTVANYPESSAYRGWGQTLSGLAKPDVRIVNLAVSGSSSKSFIKLGKWDQAIGEKPDYIFIQFGHNDRSRDDQRGTSPEGEFQSNLIRFVQEARAIGAEPILVTPPVPRAFSLKNGSLGNGRLGEYVKIMKIVAEKEAVPIVDLHTRSWNWFNTIGQERAKASAPKEGDINHYNQAGAEKLTEFILEELQQQHPQIAALFLRAEIRPTGFSDH